MEQKHITFDLTSVDRISSERLRSFLISKPDPASGELVVVDVRDEDHVGGHIKSSVHAPSKALTDTVGELVDRLRTANTVVFHCVQSKQRGPKAAIRYREKRKELLGDDSVGEGEGKQNILVLEGGFEDWQEKFGGDETLTEEYDDGVWKKTDKEAP